MNDGAPFRARCNIYNGCTEGPTFQHGRAKDAAVPSYNLTFKVNGAAVTPEALGADSNLTCSSDPSEGCQGTNYGNPFFDGTNYTSSPLGPWKNSANTTGVWPAGAVFPNQTYSIGTPSNEIVCNLTGYKSVVARRQWHGFYALDDYLSICGGTWNECGATRCGTADYYPCGTQSYENLYQPTPYATHYLTRTVAVAVTSQTILSGSPTNPGAGQIDLSMTCTQSIDANSGTYTQTGSATGYAAYYDSEGNIQYPDNISHTGPATTGYMNTDQFAALVQSFMSLPAGSSVYDMTFLVPGSSERVAWPWQFVACGTGGFDGVTITSATFSATEIHIVATGTISPYTDFTANATWDFHITLSNPITSASVSADADGLMAAWNMNDHILYPPTTQAWNGVTVLVSRNEGTPLNSLSLPGLDWTTDGVGNWTATVAATDPQIAELTVDGTALGAVLGAPLSNSTTNVSGLPASGDFIASGYYDWRYVGWKACTACETPSQLIDYYVDTNGGTVPAGLPSRATQWINLYDAIGGGQVGDGLGPGIPIGRFRSQIGGTLWVSKWWESAVRLPSYNHARPFGADAWLIDETQVGCINEVTGTGPYTLYFTNNVTIPSGAYVLLANSGQDGIYTVTTGVVASNGPLVIAYHSALPAGYTYWDAGGPSADLGICGLLRFPQCPPMAGRLAINSITDNGDGTVTVAFSAAPAPVTWAVDLCDAGMNPLVTNLSPASGASASSVTVVATYAEVKDAAWLCLYGALDSDPVIGSSSDHTRVARWYWNDVAGKGNYVLLDWTADYRTAGEANRLNGATDCSGDPLTDVPYISGSQVYNADGTPNYGYSAFSATDECKGWIACAPWAIVLSPNAADTPPAGTGVIYDFPATAPIDSAYGSYQALCVSQAMVDPLHQTPHTPCGSSTAPTCVPLVEARAILPGGGSPPDNSAGWGQNAPVPPPPVDYTIVSPVTNADGQTPPYNNLTGSTQPVQHEVPPGIFPGC